MNIETKLLEEYVNFVDNTKKQNKYFKIFLFLIAIIYFCFYVLLFLNIVQISIHTIIQC